MVQRVGGVGGVGAGWAGRGVAYWFTLVHIGSYWLGSVLFFDVEVRVPSVRAVGVLLAATVGVPVLPTVTITITITVTVTVAVVLVDVARMRLLQRGQAKVVGPGRRHPG